jgi:hypothetical protein
LANASRFSFASIVLGTILPQRGAAISQHMSAARCLLDYTMVHLAPTHLMEATIITVPTAS